MTRICSFRALVLEDKGKYKTACSYSFYLPMRKCLTSELGTILQSSHTAKESLTRLTAADLPHNSDELSES